MPSLTPWTPEHFEAAWADARRLLPGLAETTLDYTLNGMFSFTPDGFPVMGPAPRVRGAWVQVDARDIDAILQRVGKRGTASGTELLRTGLGLEGIEVPERCAGLPEAGSGTVDVGRRRVEAQRDRLQRTPQLVQRPIESPGPPGVANRAARFDEGEGDEDQHDQSHRTPQPPIRR